MRAFLLICVAVLSLGACKRDTPEAARDRAAHWLYLGEEVHFKSSPYCAVAVYRLTRDEARGNLFHVSDVDRAMWHVGRNHAGAIHQAGRSPNDFSQEPMSHNLPQGLGLLSSATGPRECMSEEIARGVYAILMTPGAWTIYDPSSDVLILVDFGRDYAVYLRGNV